MKIKVTKTTTPSKESASDSVSKSPRRRRPSEESPTWQSALTQAHDDGFELPKRPDNDGRPPSLPADLTDLDDKLLMDLMVELTRWAEYQGSRLSRAEVLERELEFRISQRNAILMIAGWGGTRDDKVAIAKAGALADEEIARLSQEHLQAYGYRKLVLSLYVESERKIATVSRELTRRTSMEPYQKRTHRHGGAG